MNRPIEASWLAVRRRADARARQSSIPVVRAMVRSLEEQQHTSDTVSLIDAGAGTGANQAWLGPAIADAGYTGAQLWHLVDHDPALLDGAPTELAGLPQVRTIRCRATVSDIGAVLQPLHPPRVLTCSALLDLLTAAEVDGLVQAAVRSAEAALWALSVTGEVTLRPAHAHDDLVTGLFNADQQRTVAGRALLGPTACAHAVRGFRRGGWSVQTVSTPWQLGPTEDALLRRWVLERAVAAAGATSEPGVQARVRSWAAARREQLDASELSALVGHTDLLALPERAISVHTSSPSR